jgi:hypothetical protein
MPWNIGVFTYIRAVWGIRGHTPDIPCSSSRFAALSPPLPSPIGRRPPQVAHGRVTPAPRGVVIIGGSL